MKIKINFTVAVGFLVVLFTILIFMAVILRREQPIVSIIDQPTQDLRDKIETVNDNLDKLYNFEIIKYPDGSIKITSLGKLISDEEKIKLADVFNTNLERITFVEDMFYLRKEAPIRNPDLIIPKPEDNPDEGGYGQET